MTDTYGTEPHEHENEHDVSHEHDVHEPPSEYEFADPSVSEEYTEEEAAASAEPTPARRSPLLPIVAAVGGVVLLGAVAWLQFGGAPTTGSVGIVNNSPVPTSLPMATPSVMTADNANVPSAPQDMAGAQAPLPSVAPKVAAAEPSPAPAPVPVPTPAPLAPVAVPPVAAPVPAALPTPAAAAPVAPVVAPAAVNAAQTQSNEVVEQRISALTVRIEDLQKKLDQTSTQLNQVANVVTANMGIDNSDAKTKDLQDRLDKLERRVTANAAPALSAPAALPPSVVVSPIASAPQVVVPAAAVHKQAHKVEHKAHAESHKKAHRVASVAKTPAAPAWVLRAATPVQAWVATSSASRELKPLRVGDTFDGIGQVVSIQQRDGNWVVEGTKGIIQ